MAYVTNQGVIPITKELMEFIPDLISLQCETPYAKKLVALPAFLAAALPDIVKKTGSKIGSDGFGWSYPITKDARVSLVIAIVNSKNEVCIYDRRDNDIGLEQNSNIGADALGSKGFAVNSLYDKVPEEAWSRRIKSARIAREIAWEKTDGLDDCVNVFMPVIVIELKDNPLPSISVSEITNPTAKMQVVINELKKS
jgi:hypothetical protein